MNNITLDDLKHICRVCLMEDKLMLPLENSIGDCTIQEELEKILCTKISTGNCYPTLICSICLNSVNLILKFQDTFTKSETRLNELLNPVVKADDFSENNAIQEQYWEYVTIKIVDDPEDTDSLPVKTELDDENVQQETCQSIKEEIQESGRRFSCQFCTKSFKTKAIAKKHVEYIHFTCVKCHEKFPTNYDLCKHLLEMHKESKFKPALIEGHKCPHCDKPNATRTALLRHIAYHHSQIISVCDICGHVSKTASQSKRHQLHHIGKTVQCDECPKQFYADNDLKAHKKIHENKRVHLCTICGKDFMHQSSMAKHMDFHKNKRKYKCDHCEKTYFSRGTLNDHIRTHTGEKPYSCSFCGKKFRLLVRKKYHENNVHTGIKKYSCSYCDKAFNDKYRLNVHCLVHKGSFVCDFCDKSFVESKFLKLHCKVSHKNNE